MQSHYAKVLRAIPTASLVPVAVASLFFTVGASYADSYKWCAVESGGTNCGFVTMEQCRTTISGRCGF